MASPNRDVAQYDRFAKSNDTRQHLNAMKNYGTHWSAFFDELFAINRVDLAEIISETLPDALRKVAVFQFGN